jgi:dTDP-4-amino-4,6-dideoxygalactose transaminase
VRVKRDYCNPNKGVEHDSYLTQLISSLPPTQGTEQMRSEFLPFSPPLIGEEEIAEVVDTLRSDWLTTGPKVKRFEEEFAAFVNGPEALAVSSCTAALHLALLALEIGPGDGVITSSLTFCSAVHVIEHVGARPILVDVEPGTLNLDVSHARRAIEHAKREYGVTVKAIMPVHLYGQPCDLDALLTLAEEHKLAIIEDAAHSLPAKYRGAMIGSHAGSARVPVLTCFSFYATKNLTTAEGGMLVSTPELLEKARVWALHGMNRDAWKRYGAAGSWRYEVVCPGYKYNMSDVQAAMGIRQLRKLPEFHSRRKQIVDQYSARLSKCEEVQIPVETPGTEHAWHLYVLRLNLESLTITRDQFISQLKSRNIGASVHFIPIHLHSYYRQKYRYLADEFPVAWSEFQRIVSLPLSPRMTWEDTNDVIAAVTDIVQQQSAHMENSKRVGAASV